MAAGNLAKEAVGTQQSKLAAEEGGASLGLVGSCGCLGKQRRAPFWGVFGILVECLRHNYLGYGIFTNRSPWNAPR
jgi:hypothetical protein